MARQTPWDKVGGRWGLLNADEATIRAAASAERDSPGRIGIPSPYPRFDVTHLIRVLASLRELYELTGSGGMESEPDRWDALAAQVYEQAGVTRLIHARGADGRVASQAGPPLKPNRAGLLGSQVSTVNALAMTLFGRRAEDIKNCAHCGGVFATAPTARKDTRFCSGRCRMNSFYRGHSEDRQALLQETQALVHMVDRCRAIVKRWEANRVLDAEALDADPKEQARQDAECNAAVTDLADAEAALEALAEVFSNVQCSPGIREGVDATGQAVQAAGHSST